MLDISLYNKIISIDFYLIIYNSPHNKLIGSEWTHQMGAVALAFYQCLKFPEVELTFKVMSNHWKAYRCKEEQFDKAQTSEVIRKNILKTSQS